MRQKLDLFYRLLLANWSAIAAVTGVVGVLVTYFVPNLQEYTAFFIFILGGAIVFTLIEIKTELLRKPKATRYNDMRAAREDILRNIREAIASGNPRETMSIQIVGGRIRTISDMIREIKYDITTRRIQPKSLVIKIHCLDPDSVAGWRFTGLTNEAAFRERIDRYAGMIRQFSDELSSFNSLPEFRDNGISVEIYHYESFPFFYGYFIGESRLFWGFFTWNAETEDFEGPENPCYYLDSKDEHFMDTRRWLFSVTEFLRSRVGHKHKPGETGIH